MSSKDTTILRMPRGSIKGGICGNEHDQSIHAMAPTTNATPTLPTSPATSARRRAALKNVPLGSVGPLCALGSPVGSDASDDAGARVPLLLAVSFAPLAVALEALEVELAAALAVAFVLDVALCAAAAAAAADAEADALDMGELALYREY